MLKYRIKRKNKLKDQSGKKIKKRRRNIVRIQDILYHMARWNVDVNFFFFNFNFNASLQTTSWALLIEEFKTNHTQQGSCVLLELQKMLVRLYVLCLGLSPDQAPADFYLRTGLKSIKFTGNNLCLSFIKFFHFFSFFQVDHPVSCLIVVTVT
jgi:hypothetical protein